MNYIETKHLCKAYGHKVILDDVSITVREGDIYGLVGRNGAGKTTLIRAILGIASPDSGDIVINGAIGKSGLEHERSKIDSIIDSPALILHLSALDNMKAAAIAYDNYDEQTLRDLLRLVGLNADDKIKVKNFSLGMKQRLAIALALIGNPKLIILDEPTNGLDPAGIVEMRELFLKLNREHHVTMIISSHLLSELSKVATCYGIIEKGKLVKELRAPDIEELCRPYIKVVVDDLKYALNVVTENFSAHDYEIMPYNSIAIYDLSKDVSDIVQLFSGAGVHVLNILKCEGDLESTFISLMGGLGHEEH